MAVSSLVNRNNYIGAASTATYPYGFRIFEDSNLQVIVRVIATGIETTLTLTTHYTVTGAGALNGGNVVLVNGAFAWQNGSGYLLSTYEISIRRVMPLTQATPFRDLGSFFPESHEDAFDKADMIAQQQQDQIDRSLRMSDSVDPDDFDPEIPASYFGSQNAIIMLNSDGTAISETPFTSAELIAAATLGGPFTTSRVLRTNSSTGLAEASSTTNTQLSYLDATSSIQTQMDLKAPLASPTFTGTVVMPANFYPRSMVNLKGANGHGSTNTKIRRFTTTVTNTGSAITYTDSAGDGATFTINEAGVYAISWSDSKTASDTSIGITLNDTELTTDVFSKSQTSEVLAYSATAGATYSTTVSTTVLLAVNDVIRAHTDGTPNGSALTTHFIITQVSK